MYKLLPDTIQLRVALRVKHNGCARPPEAPQLTAQVAPPTRVRRCVTQLNEYDIVIDISKATCMVKSVPYLSLEVFSLSHTIDIEISKYFLHLKQK